jgi:hypothetical protein
MRNLSKHNLLKLYTPRTPRSKIIAFGLVLLVALPFLGISQKMKHEIKPITDYENSFMVHIGEKYDLANYRVKEVKKKWWYWLPNIGFTFGLPHISFNSNQLAVFDKQNEERKLKQLELHEQFRIQYNEGLQVIRTKFRLIQIKEIEYREEIRKFYIIEEIHKIEMSAFDKEGSTPLEKLKADLVFTESNNYLNMLDREIEKMILDLEVYSFYDLPNLPFRLDPSGCILDNKDFQK